MAFTFIDLFAGIGGFHAALDPIGGECVFVSEIDSAASDIYSKNWLKSSGISVAGDIKELTKNIKVNIPNHDVLTAGFPCQPFSKSGHQLGVNETRGTLFYHILEIVEEKKPKVILLENVRNLVGPKHYKDYLIIIKLLRKLGYAVSDEPTILSPHEIPTRFGGTPQHRDRVFIGAIKVGEKRANELSDLSPLLPRQPFKRYGEIIWDISKSLNEYGVNTEISKVKISKEKSNALKMWNEFLNLYREFNNSNPPGLPLWSDYWSIRKNIKIPKSVPDWKKQFILRNIEIYEVNAKWINLWRKKHDLGSHITSNRKFEWQGRNQEDIYKCLIQFRPSGIRCKEPNYVPAFVALTQTPVLGWEKREITVREASLLQGFNKDFSFYDQRDSLSLKQIGNAVHPASAQLVFKAIINRAKYLKLPWANGLMSQGIDNPNLPSTFFNNHSQLSFSGL
jgi:DNA (cytosine-5)-methyltransferase 1